MGAFGDMGGTAKPRAFVYSTGLRLYKASNECCVIYTGTYLLTRGVGLGKRA